MVGRPLEDGAFVHVLAVEREPGAGLEAGIHRLRQVVGGVACVGHERARSPGRYVPRGSSGTSSEDVRGDLQACGRFAVDYGAGLRVVGAVRLGIKPQADINGRAFTGCCATAPKCPWTHASRHNPARSNRAHWSTRHSVSADGEYPGSTESRPEGIGRDIAGVRSCAARTPLWRAPRVLDVTASGSRPSIARRGSTERPNPTDGSQKQGLPGWALG